MAKKLEVAERPMPDTIPAQFRVERRHVAALREEALKRAQERGSGRLDTSEVLREILNEWMAKRAR